MADRALPGNTDRVAPTFWTRSLRETCVIAQSRPAGATTKKNPASTTMGTQKSGLWYSWRRSVRATTSTRERDGGRGRRYDGAATAVIRRAPEAYAARLRRHEVRWGRPGARSRAPRGSVRGG